MVWDWGTVGLRVHGEGQRCQARDRGFCKLVYFFRKAMCLKGLGVIKAPEEGSCISVARLCLWTGEVLMEMGLL